METVPPPAEATYRPKALLFSVLAVLWLFPSLGGAMILALGFERWRSAASIPEAVAATSVEQWTALALIAAHPVFVWLARRYWRTEPPRPVPPLPEDDPSAPEEQD